MTIPKHGRSGAEADCADCAQVFAYLDTMFSHITNQDAREHFAAAVGSWWAQRSLDMFDGNPVPLATCIANILQECGLAVDFVAAAEIMKENMN